MREYRTRRHTSPLLSAPFHKNGPRPLGEINRQLVVAKDMNEKKERDIMYGQFQGTMGVALLSCILVLIQENQPVPLDDAILQRHNLSGY